MGDHKLRTSREVYDRIRWDPRFDSSRFFIGYDAHSQGMKEIPFDRFVPGGDIPWHRVQYFRDETGIVWSRSEKIDRIFGEREQASSGSSSARNPGTRWSRSPGEFFWPVQPFRFDARSGEWRSYTPPAPDTSARSRERVSVATFNVLFDLYDAEKTYAQARVPAILAELERLDADVIALQEVTPSFLTRFLAADWLRSGYIISDSLEGATVVPYGQVLLSRLPVLGLYVHEFTEEKRAIVAELDVGGSSLVVAVVHLPSDRAFDAPKLRKLHLSRLLAELPGEGNPNAGAAATLVVGDFNAGEGELEELPLLDVWTSLRPGQEGFTYDAQRNPLAALTSSHGRRARFDRMLLHAGASGLRPRSVALFGEAPFDLEANRYPSDHFGLRAELESGPSPRDAEPRPAKPAATSLHPPVHTSALVLVPPRELWAPIQAIRTVHDRGFERWMPHLTLVYGFVSEEHFEEAERVLAAVLAEVPPFKLRLEGVGRFQHRGSVTVWMGARSVPEDAIVRLQAAVQDAFPHCDEQRHHSADGFVPHVTLARFGDPQQAARKIAEWNETLPAAEFEVAEVQLISRRGDEPFEVRRTVRLSGSGADPVMQALSTVRSEEGPEEARQVAEALSELETACALAAESTEVRLELVGSRRLGIHEAGSDVDVVCVGPAAVSRDEFFNRLRAELETTGALDWARVAADALNPVLRMSYRKLDVDVAYVPVVDETATDEPGRRSLLAMADADALAAVADARGQGALFRSACRAVRAWARARKIDSNALGFLGGFSWGVLVAWAMTRRSESPSGLGPFLAGFFELLAGWDWAMPVALDARATKPPADSERDRMVVLAPVPPSRNTARNITRSTHEAISRELVRATEIARRRDWSELVRPFEPSEEVDESLELSVATRTAEEREETRGRFERDAVGLVARLEQHEEVFARPVEVRCDETGVRLVLGLGDRRREGRGGLPREAEGALDEALEWMRGRATMRIEATRSPLSRHSGSPAAPPTARS